MTLKPAAFICTTCRTPHKTSGPCLRHSPCCGRLEPLFTRDDLVRGAEAMRMTVTSWGDAAEPEWVVAELLGEKVAAEEVRPANVPRDPHSVSAELSWSEKNE